MMDILQFSRGSIDDKFLTSFALFALKNDLSTILTLVPRLVPLDPKFTTNLL